MHVATRSIRTLARTDTVPFLVTRRWSPRLWDLVSVIGLAILALALNWTALSRPRHLPASGPGSDLWVTHWGNAAYLKESFATYSSIPLWNWQIMSGRPAAGDPLFALTYPPMQLVHLFEVHTFFLVIMIGHLVLAGVGTYALTRWGVRLSPLAAFAAAVTFMWSPRLVGHYGAGHLTMEMSASWLSLVALGLVLAFRDHAIWAAVAGLSLGMLILAGHPQIAFYAVLMIAGITAGGVVWTISGREDTRDRVRAALRVTGLAGAGTLIGTLVGASLILPALEFTGQSLREAGLALRDGTPPADFFLYLFWVPFEESLPHERTMAPGIVTLFLTPFAFVRRPVLAAGLLGATAVISLFAMGDATRIGPFVFEHLPGFAYFRAPGRIWFLASLAIAILAGIGFQSVIDHFRRVPWLPVVVVLLLIANLWAMSNRLVQIGGLDPGFSPSWLEGRISELDQGDRVYGVQRNVRQASLAAMGIELADGQDPLQIGDYSRFMQAAGGYVFDDYALAIPPFEVYDGAWGTYQIAQPDARLLGLFSVGTVVSRYKLEDPDLLTMRRLEDNYIYRNSAALPRAYLISRSLGQGLEAGGIEKLVEYAQTVGMEPDPEVGSVEMVERGPNSVTIRLDVRQDGYLILSDPWYPGWQADIDGRTVQTRQMGGVLQGVAIPAGLTEVTVEYRPASVQRGVLLSLAGVFGAVAWAGVCMWRERRLS